MGRRGRRALPSRGFYGIGIVGSKTPLNVGTLWRSAFALDASFVFTCGRRYPRQASDTVKAWRHVPLLEFADADAFWEAVPYGCVPVAVELAAAAHPLSNYVHPERAVYLLGAEDHGLPAAVLDRCRDVVQLPGSVCLNVAVAGSIVMYDRAAKRPPRPLPAPAAGPAGIAARSDLSLLTASRQLS